MASGYPVLCRIYAALSRSLLSAGEDTLQSSARFQPFFLPPNRYACIHTNILFCIGQQDIAKTIAHAEGFIIFWGRAGTICVFPPCLPKSAAGGGSQWREAFILTIDGWRLLRYCPCYASHRTISVAAAQITLSAASVPVVLTCSPIAAIMKTQFQTQDTMQTQTG